MGNTLELYFQSCQQYNHEALWNHPKKCKKEVCERLQLVRQLGGGLSSMTQKKH